jgi:hypothetical protein
MLRATASLKSVDHAIAPTDKLLWMDGFRFSFVDKDVSYILDYDGSNEQQLMPSLSGGPFITADLKNMFAVAPSKTVNGRFSLTQTSLQKK